MNAMIPTDKVINPVRQVSSKNPRFGFRRASSNEHWKKLDQPSQICLRALDKVIFSMSKSNAVKIRVSAIDPTKIELSQAEHATDHGIIVLSSLNIPSNVET